MSRLLLTSVLAAAILCGCASAPPPAAPPAPAAAPAPIAAGQLPHYRCDQQIEFTVRYGEDSATIDAGSRGRELLLRDAGGLTPQQTVYSNPRLRAEFGLGSAGNEAVLRYAAPPLTAQCRRD